jgi:hypothetical protein
MFAGVYSLRMVRIAAVACVLALALVGGADAARPLVTAIHEPQTTFAGADHSLLFDRIAGSGSTAVRLWLDWRATAPTKPSNPGDPNDSAYAWSAVDRDVASARARGLRVLFTFYEAPKWAERGATGRQGSNDPDPVQFGLFARAAALRYQGQVFDWEIWNEPNLDYFFWPQWDSAGGSLAPSLYRALVNSAASAIHGVNPGNRVVAGATAPFGHEGRSHAPLDFMRKVLCLSPRNQPTCSARTELDAWSTHPYTDGGPTTAAYSGDNVSLGGLSNMRRVLRAAERAGNIVSSRPAAFWVTEFSWDTKGPDERGVPHRLHARWTSEALYRMWNSGVTLVTWWLLRDRPFPTNLAQSGFYFCGAPSTADDSTCWSAPAAGDASKRSLRAFRFPFVAFVRNGQVFVWGRTPAGVPARVRIERKIGPRWRRVGTLSTNRYGLFSRTMRSSARRGYFRARLGTGEASVPFSLVRPRERRLGGFVFGCGGGVPC